MARTRIRATRFTTFEDDRLIDASREMNVSPSAIVRSGALRLADELLTERERLQTSGEKVDSGS